MSAPVTVQQALDAIAPLSEPNQEKVVAFARILAPGGDTSAPPVARPLPPAIRQSLVYADGIETPLRNARVMAKILADLWHGRKEPLSLADQEPIAFAIYDLEERLEDLVEMFDAQARGELPQ